MIHKPEDNWSRELYNLIKVYVALYFFGMMVLLKIDTMNLNVER